MVEEKTWEEFRKTGLLWWINRILHTFGWAIAIVVEKDGTVSRCYPARVKYRGFKIEDEEKGFLAVSKYMAEKSEELERECNE